MKVLLFLLLTFAFFGMAAAAAAITCTAGEFSRCHNASVTCHFPENIRVSRKNFNIVQYPFNKAPSGSDSGTYALVCNWGDGDSLNCNTEAGFVFSKQVSDKITLDIPDVTANVGGVYVCQLVPDSGVPLETCTLKVKNYEPPPIQNVCTPVNCGREDLIIAVLVLLLILVLTVCVVIFIFVKSRYLLVRKPGDPKKDRFICCGSTCVIQRRPSKQADAPKAPDSDSEKKVDAATAPAVMQVKNEADKQKRSAGIAEDSEPLLKAPETSKPVAAKREQQYNESQPKTDTDERIAKGPPSAQTVHSERRPTSSQENRQNPVYDDEGRASPPTGHAREPTRVRQGQHISESAQRQLTVAGIPIPAVQPQRWKALNYGNWTTEQVRRWLEQEQIDEGLVDKFEDKKVNGRDLVKNDKSFWKKIGLDDKEQSLIKEKVKALQKTAREEMKLKNKEDKASKKK